MKDLREIVDILREIEQILGFEADINIKNIGGWKGCNVQNVQDSGAVVWLWFGELYKFLTGKNPPDYGLFEVLSSSLGFEKKVSSLEDFVKELYRFLGGKER